MYVVHKTFFSLGIISSEDESLFTYGEGQSFQTFYDPFYVPMYEVEFDDPSLEATALEICGEDQFCLYDIAATRNVSIGLTTLMGGEAFDLIVNMSAPGESCNKVNLRVIHLSDPFVVVTYTGAPLYRWRTQKTGLS